MTEGTLRKISAVLANSNAVKNCSSVELLWHSGEPLVVGLPFYRKAHAIFHETGIGEIIRQTFQTNGTLIDASWCRYFVESKSTVGVSLDGPREVNDAQRHFRSGRGSFDSIMRGISFLREHAIPINVLCVLTPISLERPEQMFDFFATHGIHNIGFNIEEVEGVHRRSTLSLGGPKTIAQYYNFMRRFLELNRESGGLLRIRELQIQSRYLWHRARMKSFSPTQSELQIGKLFTISRDGHVFSWSPELASGYPRDPTRFSLGNIHDISSFEEVLETATAQRIQLEIDAGVDQCRQTCDYFSVCGGGSPANKLYENGSFDSTQTLKCRLNVQTVTDAILDYATAD